MENTKNNLAGSAPIECFVQDTRQPIRITDSLEAVAGDLAPIFAEIDPFPHHHVLGKPRTYLYLIAFTYINTKSFDLAKQVLDQNKFSAGVEICFGERLIGLEGVLKKCPPQLFEADIYQKFHKIIPDENSLKTLRHCQWVTAQLIETIYNLPGEFRCNRVVWKIKSPAQALIIALAAHGSPEQRQIFAHRLGETRSLKKFWELIGENLLAQIQHMPVPPEISHPNFFALDSLLRVVKASIKFRNCLRSYISEALNGQVAFYVFSRNEDLAVISIQPRFGTKGVVTEIKGPQNAPVPDKLLQEIHEILKTNGFKIATNEWNSGVDLDHVSRKIRRMIHESDVHTLGRLSNEILKDALELIL